jgi:hypothetical protein
VSQPGWYPDPAAPSLVRWWDGYRWTNDVRPGGPGGSGWPGGPGGAAGGGAADLADEARYGRRAAGALWVGAAAFSCQAFLLALLTGRFFHAVRTQLDAPLRSDGTRPPLVLPHSLAAQYALSQLVGIALLAVEVIFLIWFYKAATVAAQAGLPARRSPAWAVIGWIIPIVNFWFPYQSAIDMLPPGHPARHRVNRWWALYLTMSFSTLVPPLASLASTGVGLALALLVAVLAFAAAAAARSVIDEITRAHAELLRR